MCPAANSSSRWCPTPEQLMILEEMYRAGTRTPNASQIQQITAHLSFYGKIEGKNVFYWFQNHKARDRQKLRRKLYKQLQQQQLAAYHHHHQQLMTTTNSTTSYNHNNNFTNNTQKNHSHFLGYNSINHQFPASASSSHFHQQLTCYNSSISAGSIPQVLQVGVDQDHAPTHQLLNYTWKVEIPADHHHHHQSRIEIKESSMMKMYDRDWMMIMDQVGPPHSPARCNKPLKTLELFPITATNLKEECTSRSSNMLHLPCSSPATNQKL